MIYSVLRPWKTFRIVPTLLFYSKVLKYLMSSYSILWCRVHNGSSFTPNVILSKRQSLSTSSFRLPVFFSSTFCFVAPTPWPDLLLFLFSHTFLPFNFLVACLVLLLPNTNQPNFKIRDYSTAKKKMT